MPLRVSCYFIATVVSVSALVGGIQNSTRFNPPSNRNTQPHQNSSGRSVQGAGFGAEGTVDTFGNGNRGVYDYDSTTATRFVRKTDPNAPNAPGTISYPFNPDARFDLDFFMEEAKKEGTY
jgi:hypothetical protein